MSAEPAFSDWPDGPDRKRAKTARGMIAARLELAAKGVAPPTDERHAEFYDPPLTRAETRHRFHVSHELDCSAFCRFGAEEIA